MAVVKKITNAPTKIITKKTITKTVTLKPRKPDLSGLALPDAPKERDLDLNHYTLLIYGREKIGKTTILSKCPDSIFFATEPGTKGLSVFEFNSQDGGVKNWDIFRKGVDLLVQNKGKFKTVIIDTVDRAYDMCMDWVCENLGVEYPGRDTSGKEDYGKSWRAVKMEFLEQMHRINQEAGMGICFTSHCKEEVHKEKGTGNEYTRIFPSMSNQARKVVEAMVDLFFYAEYVRGENGGTRRILICEGDETIWAGARETAAGVFPKYLPMDRLDGYKVIQAAFLGEDIGLDPVTILPTPMNSKTVKTFLQKERTKAAIVAAK